MFYINFLAPLLSLSLDRRPIHPFPLPSHSLFHSLTPASMHFTPSTVALAVAALASGVAAHAPAGLKPSHVVARQAASTTLTEDAQRKIEDPTQECKYYYEPAVNALLPSYPKVRRDARRRYLLMFPLTPLLHPLTTRAHTDLGHCRHRRKRHGRTEPLEEDPAFRPHRHPAKGYPRRRLFQRPLRRRL